MFFDKRKLLNHSLPKYRLSFILNVFETHTHTHTHTRTRAKLDDNEPTGI